MGIGSNSGPLYRQSQAAAKCLGPSSGGVEVGIDQLAGLLAAAGLRWPYWSSVGPFFLPESENVSLR